ncbi:MAG: DUF420 domain-containing protein, partial [Deltaproteobacteria bacterium]|nr:DUF420 domain-containing protein [Deltaproteobacteria bacterium]
TLGGQAIDPKLAFWTWAFCNTTLVVACCIAGVVRIRGRRAREHRRMMRIAASLVGLFLVSYMVKLPVLGREDRSLWSTSELWTLYTHELCIFAMLVAGAVAALRARRFGEIRDGPNPAPEADERDRRLPSDCGANRGHFEPVRAAYGGRCLDGNVFAR